MKVSNHATQRGQQRGIPEALMILIAAFGRPVKVKGGAIAYVIDKRGKKQIEKILREGVQLLDKIGDKKVICSDDDSTIITCYTSDFLH